MRGVQPVHRYHYRSFSLNRTCERYGGLMCCCCCCCQVYMAGAQGPAANLALLDHMLAARHQLGTLLGFQSYAAFKAADGTLAGKTYGPRPAQHSHCHFREAR
jgi:hypothetical protein